MTVCQVALQKVSRTDLRQWWFGQCVTAKSFSGGFAAVKRMCFCTTCIARACDPLPNGAIFCGAMLEGRRLSCDSVARRPREITMGDTSNMRHVQNSRATNATCVQESLSLSLFSFFSLYLCHFSWICEHRYLQDAINIHDFCAPSSRWPSAGGAPWSVPHLERCLILRLFFCKRRVRFLGAQLLQMTWPDAEGLAQQENIVDWTLTARPFAVLISLIKCIGICDKLDGLDRQKSSNIFVWVNILNYPRSTQTMGNIDIRCS